MVDIPSCQVWCVFFYIRTRQELGCASELQCLSWMGLGVDAWRIALLLLLLLLEAHSKQSGQTSRRKHRIRYLWHNLAGFLLRCCPVHGTFLCVAKWFETRTPSPSRSNVYNYVYNINICIFIYDIIYIFLRGAFTLCFFLCPFYSMNLIQGNL